MKLRAAAASLSLSLIYALVYQWVYVSFLYFHFEYVGYDLFARDFGFMVTSFAIAVLPAICYRGMRAVSSAVAVLVYLVLYIPIILTFALGSSRPPSEILLVQLTFMVGMVCLFLADVMAIRNPLRLDVGVDLMPFVLVMTWVFTAYVLFTYRGSLQFSTFGADLYEQRAANEVLGGGIIARYVGTWLQTVLIPLCLAFGLSARRHRYTASGVGASLVMYMGAANKLSILLPFVYLGFYLVFRKRIAFMLPMMAGSLIALIASMLWIATLGRGAFLAAAIVLNRTIGSGGQITVAYYDFFAFYPRTGYSHVNGLNLFTRAYPYGSEQIGQVIGQFYWSPFMNANANFWATDGIAALGLPGVFIISIAAVGLFLVMNVVTESYDRMFAVLCFLPFTATLLNQSLFSSFWSGGGFFLILFFAFNRRPRMAASGSALRSLPAFA